MKNTVGQMQSSKLRMHPWGLFSVHLYNQIKAINLG